MRARSTSRTIPRPPLLPVLAALLLALAAAPAARAGMEDGLAAYQRGDYRAAVAALLPVAKTGQARAQFYLGQMYRQGQGGLPKDAKTAAEWYARAGAQGLVVAQYNLAQMYRTGDGVPRDPGRAVRWYRLAAEQGHARAQDSLGLMYAGGMGVERDLAEAYAWVALAAGRLDGRAEHHRREILSRMAPDELETAHKRARFYAERYGTWTPGDVPADR
jgi:TPR repeat protein